MSAFAQLGKINAIKIKVRLIVENPMVVLCGDPGGCGGTGQPSVILPNFSASNVVVTQQTIGTAKYVTVSITGYPYQPLIFDLNAMVGASFNMNLSPNTKMRYMIN